MAKLKEDKILISFFFLSGVLSGSGSVLGLDPADLVGKRCRTKWPYDNSFYVAVITDYDPVKVYWIIYCSTAAQVNWIKLIISCL